VIRIDVDQVGLYASLINVNAYHQPGVQAGKVAADAIIRLKSQVMKHLYKNSGQPLTAQEIAAALGCPEQIEMVYKLCEHLAANPDRGFSKTPGSTPFLNRYCRS
jgi:glucose-6-phosphate isomerase